MSMPTWPKTCRLASATKTLPGPVILSTRGTVSVPQARAATAWAPPQRKTRSTPAMRAAARMTGFTSPPQVGGETMTISRHPAILAGMAFISTVEG